MTDKKESEISKQRAKKQKPNSDTTHHQLEHEKQEEKKMKMNKLIRVLKKASKPEMKREEAKHSGLQQYTIRFGETITPIAERFHITVSELLEMNERLHTRVEFPGDTIYVPA